MARHPPCLTFFASPDTPSDFWQCHAGRLSAFWALISLCQSARPRTAVPGPRPPRYLHAQTWARPAAAGADRIAQDAGQERPAGSQKPPGVHSQPRVPSPAAKVRAAPPGRPPASLKLQPSEEKKEQNHKFRLIKHLLILQQFSRPLRNPPETRGAPVIFCYIIFLVKYFPRQSPQRGSNITVTNQNQCALTY